MGNLAEMGPRINRAIKSPATRVAGVGLLTAAVAGACTPEQIQQVQKLFPCEPIAEASRSNGVSVIARSEPIKIPATLTSGQEITICLPTDGDMVTGEPKQRPILRHTGQELIDASVSNKKRSVKVVEKRMIETVNHAYEKPIDQVAVDKILPYQSDQESRSTATNEIKGCINKPKKNITADPQEYCSTLVLDLMFIHAVSGDQNFFDAAVETQAYFSTRWPNELKTLEKRILNFFPEGQAYTTKDF